MRCFDLEVHNNKFENKKDINKFIMDLLKPLKSSFVRNNTRIHLSNRSSAASDNIAQIEGFSRIIWGLSALDDVDKDWAFWKKVREGLVNGTNPEHEDYFGKLGDYDQRLVEMAAIGYAMVLKPECIYEPLDNVQKKNLYNWLNQTNELEVYDCNWKFFTIIINIGFKSVGLPYDKNKMNGYLDDLDSYYMSDGWYRDGDIKEAHADYYIAFAMHYYGLFYSIHMKDIDPQRAKRYSQRAVEFAEEFIYWFAEDGEALPYGRSLAYRFAQVAFWSMVVVADVKTSFLLGTIKGIIMRHLRWWNKQAIYDVASRLTIGYAYDNPFVVEGYISPGSVYWGLKTLVIGTLADNHDFWVVEEKPLPQLMPTKIQEAASLVIKRDIKSRHVIAYNAGNYHTNGHLHVECKYEKFAYSTFFGFSVPRSHKGLEFGAFDSTLAVSMDGNYYRHKEKSIKIKLDEQKIKTVWSPYEGVIIHSYLLIGHPWHIRIHKINSDRILYTAEGGFAIGLESLRNIEFNRKIIKKDRSVTVVTDQGYSQIADLYGNQEVEVICPASNTNIMNPRTLLPTLRKKLGVGENILASYVRGDNIPYKEWEVPELSINGDVITVTSGNEEFLLELN
ncbi:MAG TPA: DUF2264 domain-containing protein [Epulopiscium sp.]|nr:DUF2264 domain-containing protein [Candidatus Epulonipiscium sp.]